MRLSNFINHLLITLVFFGVSNNGFSQANACSGVGAAETLTVNGACLTGGSWSDNTVNDPTVTTCGATANRDGWNRFTAIGTSTTVFFDNTSSPARDAVIYIYTGACGALTYFGCMDATGVGLDETYTFTTVAATVYYVRIVAKTGSLTGNLCINGPPSNDSPSGATSIAVGATCSFTAASNMGSTATTCGTISAPGCGGASYTSDVWYSVVVPASGQLVIDTENGGYTMLDAAMAVYTGTACGVMTPLACDDNSSGSNMPMISLTGLTVGATLYIRVWGVGGTFGTYGICVTSPPVNDDPTGATPITVGTTCSYTSTTNVYASASTCGTIPAPGCAAYTTGDVWYSCIVPFSGQLIIDTQAGGITDGGLAAYSGSPCGVLTLLGCDDNTGAGSMPQLSLSGLTPGATVYIRVWGNSGATGTFGICVTDPSPPLNYLVPSTGNNSITVCSGTIQDHAGSSDYTNSVSGYTVINPAIAGNMITLTFTQFALECCCDYVRIYDGAGIGGTLLWSGNCTTLPPVITSSLGPLTIQFTSDGSVVAAGFTASISCAPPCTPPARDLPCGATALTMGTPLSTDNICTDNTSEPAMPTCWTTGNVNTAWYSFVAPASGNASVNVTAGTISASQFGVYSGPCTAPVYITGACATTSGPICLSGLTPGATYYIVVDGQNNNKGTYTVLAADPASVSCASLLGTGVTNVASLPYASGAGTTCGFVNDLTSSNMVTCGSTSYLGGEDKVWIFTPASSGQVTISVTSTGSYMGLTLYANCPITTTCAGSSGVCVAYSQSYLGNQSFCTNVTAGTTYYLVMDSWPSPTCNAYTNLTISAPSGTPAGTVCSTAPSITLPYSAVGHTTACYGNDYTNASIGSCGTLYESGEDRVYAYTATGPECIGITLSNGSTTSLGFQVYSGCPGAAGTTCLGGDGGGSPVSNSVTLPGAGTYYIVVDTWSTPYNADYDIDVITYGSGPTNDLPCSATPMTLGTSASGDNTCSGGTGEPAVPACWTSGNNNSVWFSVVATSTTMKIKTTLGGTLTNTQIAVYSGTCGAGLTLVSAAACNDDAPACGFSGSNYYSELSLTGLTAGTTYYIRVDGTSNLVGSFSVLAIDGASSFPTVAGMDCIAPNPVCLSTFVVADPGYNGYGAVCDLPTSYCLASAERNIVWYTIPINANGTLSFDIVPNDFNPLTSSETDYDFGLWKIGGAGAVTCADIAAGSATPLRCNYSGLGVTGLNGATGNAPNSLSAGICPTCGAYNPSPTYDGAYESNLAVNNGDTYLLAISNFSSSVSGFGIDFLTSPIGYTGSTTTSVTWTGGTNTAWNLNSNWGGCNYPTCSIDATIVPLGIQPTIVGTMSVKDLYINPGATLTLAAGSTLIVCGSITNFGNIIASPTSTILFNDNTTTHQMTGSFVGANKLGHLTLTDLAGGANMLVTLNNDLDMGGNFTTSNATSIFNTQGKYIRVAGNFVNNNGATTFTNVGTTGTLEFNGTAAQTYTQGSTLLDLNFVLMNHTGTGVTLLTDMNIKTVTGTLTLTLGKIITTGAFQVYLKNKTAASCNAGNASSFVQGYLRRGIGTTTGVYEFPVGEAVKLYQRATINFTTAPTTIDNIRADFVPYGVTPGALGTIDCTVPYNLPFLDNGKWNINAYDASMVQLTGNGVYTCTLWPRAGSYTNAASAVEWTVAKDPGTGWAIVGTCNLASVVNQVIRDAMSGFSGFGVEQSTTTLPVELTFFDGQKSGKDHLLLWETATEQNNQWFILEQSTNGLDFTEIYRTEGKENSITVSNYSYLFKYPDPGINYYRLRQVNMNGTYSFSNIVVLDNNSGVVSLTNLYPNPTNGDVQFDLTTSDEGNFTIEVYDIAGKIVMQKKHYQEQGKRTINLTTSELGRGVYTLKVLGENSNFKSINRIVRN